MKQLIILLLLIIAFFIGFGKYLQYERYNTTKTNYKTSKKIDLDYYNQELVINYYKAIENLNCYVTTQWTSNDIDVKTPKHDDKETLLAVEKYSQKIAYIKYYEAKLERSLLLKQQGISNKEIKFLEEKGISLKDYQSKQEANKIKSLFDNQSKLSYGQTSALIYEIQKKLVSLGESIEVDGVYKKETKNAIKKFEAKNNLFADGFLDVLTLDTLLK